MEDQSEIVNDKILEDLKIIREEFSKLTNFAKKINLKKPWLFEWKVKNNFFRFIENGLYSEGNLEIIENIPILLISIISGFS